MAHGEIEVNIMITVLLYYRREGNMCVCENYQGLFYKIIHTYHCFILFQSLVPSCLQTSSKLSTSLYLNVWRKYFMWVVGFLVYHPIYLYLYLDSTMMMTMQWHYPCSGGDRAAEPAARTGCGHQGDGRGRGAALHRPARRPRRAPHRHVGPRHVSLLPILICPLSSDYWSSSASGEAWSSSSARSHGCSVWYQVRH